MQKSNRVNPTRQRTPREVDLCGDAGAYFAGVQNARRRYIQLLDRNAEGLEHRSLDEVCGEHVFPHL